MKSNWNYPTTMWVGKDRIKDLSIACKILNMSKPLLVTDNGLVKSKIIFDAINNLSRKEFYIARRMINYISPFLRINMPVITSK